MAPFVCTKSLTVPMRIQCRIHRQRSRNFRDFHDLRTRQQRDVRDDCLNGRLVTFVLDANLMNCGQLADETLVIEKNSRLTWRWFYRRVSFNRVTKAIQRVVPRWFDRVNWKDYLKVSINAKQRLLISMFGPCKISARRIVFSIVWG